MTKVEEDLVVSFPEFNWLDENKDNGKEDHKKENSVAFGASTAVAAVVFSAIIGNIRVVVKKRKF